MNALQKLTLNLNLAFHRETARDPAALRFLLNSLADEEGNGEGLIFERVKPFLDGQLAKLVDRHAADEVRHEKMFTAALEALGGKRTEVPEELQMVHQMGKAAGDVFEKPVESEGHVARAYLLLYAVERRAVERFSLNEEAVRPLYPELAEVFAKVKKDETRHLLYCAAVSRAMVSDDLVWTKIRDEMIELEARVFSERSRLFQMKLLDEVFVTLPWYKRLFWKSVGNLTAAMGVVQHVLDIGGAAELPGSRQAQVALAA